MARQKLSADRVFSPAWWPTRDELDRLTRQCWGDVLGAVTGAGVAVYHGDETEAKPEPLAMERGAAVRELEAMYGPAWKTLDRSGR